jgi:hypothetical protein
VPLQNGLAHARREVPHTHGLVKAPRCEPTVGEHGEGTHVARVPLHGLAGTSSRPGGGAVQRWALLSLGECFERGWGTAVDLNAARSSYAKAAAQGDEEGREALARQTA